VEIFSIIICCVLKKKLVFVCVCVCVCVCVFEYLFSKLEETLLLYSHFIVRIINKTQKILHLIVTSTFLSFCKERVTKIQSN